jgi:hypothetical protein
MGVFAPQARPQNPATLVTPTVRCPTPILSNETGQQAVSTKDGKEKE